MMKALMTERFGLAVHTENRPVDTFVLTSVKPKLRTADSSARAGCDMAAAANAVLTQSISCHNVAMAQFVSSLQRLAPSYIDRRPVVDETGIAGTWDFDLNFSPAAPPPVTKESESTDSSISSDRRVEPSDPSGSVSLSEAIRKQTGLKLKLQKRSMPALVIDHVNENPTDN
jgi:uncharacterized protein (TIGR03435 family)